MKILVRSRYKEGTSATGRIWDDGVAYLQFRQFAPPHPKANHGVAYMSPAEAKFLVESAQNRAHIDAGLEPEYSYPAGHPVPVADNFDGPFHPPLTEKSFHISDPRQLDQAENWMAERARSIELADARRAAAARGDDPAEVELPTPTDEPTTVESATARRNRQKIEREASRIGA